MSNRCLFINLGNLAAQETSVDEVEKIVLSNVCTALEKATGVHVAVYDSELSDKQKLLDAAKDESDEISFAVVKCEIVGIEELKDFVKQDMPQHEHNKDLN